MRDELLPTALANLGSAAVPNAESEASRWANVPHSALVGFIGLHDNGRVRDGCSAELGRRYAASLEAFRSEAAQQTAKLIGLSEETSRQTDKLIALTR